MAHVGESSSRPRDNLLFTKPGCKSCAKARKLLDARGWAYEEVPASPRRLRAVSAKSSTPQIFIDGTHIGSADDPQTYLARTT
jgi:glutaredoxin